MGRVYTISFAGVSVTAVQDLITVFTGVKAIKLHSVVLGQVSATAVGNLAISIKRLPATITSGSGGSTPTPIPVSLNDTAATVTAHANDTSRTTTGGTAQTLVADVFNVINGYLYLPPAEDRIVVGPNEALVISLDGAPSGAEVMSGYAVVEETY